MIGGFKLKPRFPRMITGHPLTRGLQHWWLFHEGSGLYAADVTKPLDRRADAVLTSGQRWAKDDVTGVSSCIAAIGAGPVGARTSWFGDMGGNFSIQCRISPRGQATGYGLIFGVAGAAAVYAKVGGELSMYFSGDHLSTTLMTNTAANRQWYDWMVTHDQSGGAAGGVIYLDGAVDATYDAGALGAFNPNGMLDDTFPDTYIGLCDFIRVWNRTLTPGEVKTAFHAL